MERPLLNISICGRCSSDHYDPEAVATTLRQYAAETEIPVTVKIHEGCLRHCRFQERLKLRGAEGEVVNFAKESETDIPVYALPTPCTTIIDEAAAYFARASADRERLLEGAPDFIKRSARQRMLQE